jgi:hypothetical protein
MLLLLSLLYVPPTFSFRKENTKKFCFQDVPRGAGVQRAVFVTARDTQLLLM